MKLYLSLLAIVIFTNMNAQDWANVARFKAENELVIENKAPVKMVFMGNSITEGWKLFDPNFFNSTDYVNRGIGGQTTPQMLIRFKQDVLDLKPKGVVILAGTNDIAGNTGPMSIQEIYNQIESMAGLAALNKIEVFLCSVLPVYDYPWKPGLKPAPKIVALNEMLKTLAGEKNYLYIDYFSEMSDDKNGLKASLGADGVHPNEKGYEIMKRVLLNTIGPSFK
ncbi:MAG: acylhydrolase [Flavobacteriaceae bacterium]|jgi:lysophospholipase L1-like esterase|nr:MAG: acylhydrolase [Polaribacter sp. BACL8 MAG-120531-bin13]KRP01099.1 MAG: acylhydrolase [Polaribacter sp. BACL8 MAG-120619-bin41]KRP14775.1 MAG: acylhydrolase [Polaribacter sp. BACL8 MAG-120419-bin8]MBT4839436.1 acylhydrolase [Flavobacteriaceae bacterium]MDA9304112.1 GDSL-type esterase/lipase family protein [bacterium]|tara:strand:- start:8210 stop:8878 length:669 start_codon:yes stop_codon:yes gene_type:complete